MGDMDSIYGFAALGLDLFPMEDPADAGKKLRELAENDYAVIYLTEGLAEKIEAEIDRYKDALTPAIILIPGKEGPLGIGMAKVKTAVERAVGADIL